jgi:ABC-2 type transport system permease protein
MDFRNNTLAGIDCTDKGKLMIAHLFYFEWLQLRNLWGFRATVVIVPVIIALSLYSGYLRVKDQHQTITEIRASETGFYDEMTDRVTRLASGDYVVDVWFDDPSNPLVLAQFGEAGKHIVIEPKPLAALAVGQSDVFPYYGKVTLLNRTPMRDNALENPLLQATGPFDFAFVMVWLIPLFVIAMGFDVLSREKESGTYALLQSQPTSVYKILVLKIVFRFALTTAIVVLPLLLLSSVLSLSFFHKDGLIVLSMVLLYIGFWYALCIGVNFFSHRSSLNALSLAGVWVLFVLVIPAVITLLASYMHPVPSRTLWTTELRAIEQSVNADRDYYFESWKADHPQEVLEGETPVFYRTWLQRIVTNEVIQERIDAAEDRFNSARDKQQKLIEMLRPLSPAMVLHHRLQQIAGTDAAHLLTLDSRMRSFQAEWQEFFMPRFRQLDMLEPSDMKHIPRP